MTENREDRPPADRVRQVLKRLGELPGKVDATLQQQIRNPFSIRSARPIRPADVNARLREAMLAPENLLEDANYLKIVPNDYVVELNRDNYERSYTAIEQRVCEQWREKLLEELARTNRRRGRMEYAFGGRVQVSIRPVSDLAENEARILCHVSPDPAEVRPVALGACLELLPGGSRWPLRSGVMVIGREASCEIYLDDPAVQARRLVSGEHAHLHCEAGRVRLFDGSPEGRASLNGTFVNGKPVPDGGQDLHDGDTILLAALDREHPRADTPGVAAFQFRADCS